MPTDQLTQPTAKTAAPRSPLRSGLSLNGARLGELRRAVIVFEIFSFATRNPRLGRTAVINTILLAHRGEPGISERSVWRWIGAFERGGLAALVDRKPGRVGRKSEGKA
jgi:hypothetical protein